MKPKPMTTAQALSMAIEHHRNGRLAQADAIYRQILERQPNQPDALHLRGLIAMNSNRLDEAIALIRRAIGIFPKSADYHNNLGNALRQKGLIDEAIAAYGAALRLNPNLADTHNNLGNALLNKGRLDDSIAAYRKAIQLKADFVSAYANLGNVLREKGQLDESIAVQKEALRLQPNFAEVYANLGASYRENGQWDEAVEAYRYAIKLKPAQPVALTNLGELYMTHGKIEEAMGYFESAVKVAPTEAVFGSNYVFALYFDPRCGPEEILARHREVASRIAPAGKELYRGRDRDRDPERRLRIGYVSPYLFDHVIARNLAPLFWHRDGAKFEMFCYSSVKKPDAITQEIQTLSNGWRNIVGMQDDAVVKAILEDRIDILVDLTLHMAGARLNIFATKPAPVQAAFAGYPGTTGMSQIDYRLTDPYLDPPGNERFHLEESIRLPHSFWCYDPKGMNVEERFDVTPLPANSSGFITFGCLNSFHKINTTCLDLWGKVMAAVPRSRLILMAPIGGTRQWVREHLQKYRVEGNRIEFVNRQGHGDYLRTYHRIDLGLDTIPYNGHTTSLDSLWMGVPVVTLIGKTVVGRAGLSQLTNLGLAHLAANSAEEFVALATSVAADLPALAALRQGLRQRMKQSPLTDGVGFARAIEEAYRQMWRTWCARGQ